MEILEKAPECYIQQCKNCGAVLKYSECDIHAGDIPFKSDDGRDWVCSCDAFICPSCKLPIAAERTWFTGIEWIKKILDRI
jgi:hypothetical protein